MSEGSKRNSGKLSSQGALKEFPYVSEGLMESLEKGKASHKRMETRRKKTELSRGCEGKGSGKQGALGERKEVESNTHRHWPCSGAGLEGIFPLSI